MHISFAVAGEPAVFRWNNMTGKAELQVGTKSVRLQGPWSLSTHYSVRTHRTWQYSAYGHDIEIVKIRPKLLGGFRMNTFMISVDEMVVTKTRGRREKSSLLNGGS